MVLSDPTFAAAVAVLAVNDHLLKGAAPGWLTGKLSDVAGVFVVAVLTAVALRGGPAVVMTAAGFVAIKLSSEAAGWAAPVLGGVTRQDPTDLVALAALLPAWRLMRPRAGWDGRSAGRPVVRAGALVAVTLTLSATSCAGNPVVDGFVVSDGVVVAHIDRPYEGDGSPWAASADGGRSWSSAAAPSAPPAAEPNACDTGGRCWRVVQGGRQVEEQTAGGAWRSVFRFSARERKAMQMRAGACSAGPEDWFAALAVVPRPEGAHVVVAMGDQGVLHRSPAGVWERQAVLDLRPVRSSGSPDLTRDLIIVAFLIPLIAAVPLLVWGRRHPERRGRDAAVVSGVGTILVMMCAGALALLDVDFTVTGPLIVAVALTVLAAALLVARRPAPHRPPQPPGRWTPPPGQGWPPPAAPGPH